MKYTIIMERFYFHEKCKSTPETATRFVTGLKRDRAVFIQAPGYDKIHFDSLKIAQEFFALPNDEKQSANGVTRFLPRCGNLRLNAVFQGRTHSVLAAELCGRERGWVPSGLSNSQVLKEYFQYGLDASSDACGQEWIENVWPAGEFGGRFRRIKLRHLAAFCSIHLATFSLFSSYFYKGTEGCFNKPPANVLCRDTRYVPTDDGTGRVQDQGSLIRNLPHVDLAEGTLIAVEPGLEIYRGNEDTPMGVSEDSDNWTEIEESSVGADTLLYIPGLALQIRSGGEILATWHRVVGTPKLDCSIPRFSIVSFGNAGTDDLLVPLNCDPSNKHVSIYRHHLPIIGNRLYMETIASTKAAPSWDKASLPMGYGPT